MCLVHYLSPISNIIFYLEFICMSEVCKTIPRFGDLQVSQTQHIVLPMSMMYYIERIQSKIQKRKSHMDINSEIKLNEACKLTIRYSTCPHEILMRALFLSFFTKDVSLWNEFGFSWGLRVSHCCLCYWG